ncbi:hypothetical protein ACFE04_014111 [Oxalis oulophora]
MLVLYTLTRFFKRWVPQYLSSYKTLFTILWIIAFVSVFIYQTNSIYQNNSGLPILITRPVPNLRPVVFNLTDFGAVGDGVTVNTAAFEKAVLEISKHGGGQLNVGPGKWLTAPFNLTSCMTLFLNSGAQILAIEDENYWPLMPPLPSYGYGREHPGPRYGSLIHGQNLTDVVITGYNGTINGQGKSWWNKHRQKLLKHTRGPLIQIMWSRDIVISDITLRDSPFWTIHPYDCKNVTIKNLTILAPVYEAPNTDGIDPDSCEDMLIENCYISVGDDAVAIKSGWDQFGIAYGRPSTNIVIRNLVVRSVVRTSLCPVIMNLQVVEVFWRDLRNLYVPKWSVSLLGVVSAGISIGSEMSGGVSNIMVDNLLVWNSRRGIRIKTAPGRGGYIKNITYNNLTFDNVRVGVVIQTDYSEHPDEGFDPKALPTVRNIVFNGVHGQGLRVPVRIHGSKEIPLRNITFKDLSVGITYKKKHIFQCSFVQGRVIGKIFPAPCENLDQYDEQGRLVKRSTSQNITDTDDDS